MAVPSWVLVPRPSSSKITRDFGVAWAIIETFSIRQPANRSYAFAVSRCRDFKPVSYTHLTLPTIYSV